MANLRDELEFRAIVERSYLYDPDKTHDDLLKLRLNSLASDLKVEYITGRLQQNVEAERGVARH